MFVLHKCDVPHCVNPDHLYLGTQAQNVKDMIDRGRWNGAIGVNHPSNKLTEKDVKKIRNERSAGKELKELAGKYGVSKSMICAIANRRAWKWLD
jgi:hypothetical protein